MKIDDFLERLEGVTTDNAGGWLACCPGHDDHNPSMHVNVGEDGKILVKCFAGCTTERICDGMGLKVSDLMPEKAKRGRKAKRTVKPAALPSFAAPAKERDHGKVVCEYVYKDENGKVVFKVVRKVMKNGKKTFVQMSPDPANDYPLSDYRGWRYGVDKHGVAYIPYQVPRIREAAAKGRAVVICEGEKDVENVIKLLGLAATCNPKGAGKWERGWGKYFEGVPRILIVADKDDETRTDKKTGEEIPFAVGQRHACDVERKLRDDGYQGKIRKICLPDVEIEQGVTKRVKDFTDWAEAMASASRKVDVSSFQAAVEEFGEWPEKWNFQGDETIDLQSAQKEARESAFSSGEAKEEGSKGGKEEGEGERYEAAGRFGRLCPRAPLKEREYYEVDFQINDKEIARFAVGRDGIQFEGWRKSEDDEGEKIFKRSARYDAIACPPSGLVPMALGCMMRFHEGIKLANPQRTELTCSLMISWLRSRGKFFADIDNPMYSTSMYFDSVKGILYNIHSDEFFSFLANESHVSRKNKVYEFMLALIEDMTMVNEITPRVRPSKEWDRRGNVIYISNGDSRIYRVSPNKIEDVPNGTDGVVFLRGATLMPFDLVDGPGLDPFEHSMLFKYAALEKPSDVMICRLWTLNLFACHTNKPILLVNGPRGSGKTFLLQGIKQFIGIRTDGQLDDTVTKMDHSDKGSDDFWIIVDKGRFEIFDNFDYKIKWADNDLQTASTNGSHKTRVLYKTGVLVTQYARACIGLTSNNAVFAAEGGGLPDRILQAHTIGRPKVSKGPAELLADSMAHRAEYLTNMIRTLAAALADEKPVDATINRRHPEFAEFAVRCGRAIGREAEVVAALSTAEIEKATLPLLNDMIAKEIIAVLMSQEKPGNLSFTAGDMSDMIIGRFGSDETDEKTKTIYGSRRVGKTFQRFGEDFKTLFNWSTRILEGKTRYEFTGMTARGETVVDTLRGGLVGIGGENPESPNVIRGAGDLSQNASINPPIPPYARAGSQSDSLMREGNDNGNYQNKEDPDDFSF